MDFQHEEEGFFALVQRVGSKGRYQKQALLLFYLIWFVTAFIVLSTPFLFMPTRYHCPQLTPSACKQHACSLPEDQRAALKAHLVSSLINQLSEYDCEGEAGLADFKLPLFLGIFAGYLLFSYYSDNFGRRKAMLLTWGSSLTGLTLLCLSSSAEWAALGLFLTGAGCESNLRVNLAIINEIVDAHLRQAYSIILQSAFGAAGLAIAASYYLLRDWRQVTLLFCLLPAVLVMFGVVLRLQETPLHLAGRGSAAVLASLRRIAKINGLECSVREQDVERAVAVRVESQRVRQMTRRHTLLDLFRFPSLKRKSLYLCLMLFCIASLYLGPNTAIESLGGDLFMVQVLLSLPDCLVYPLACATIHLVERRRAGLKSLGIACVCLLVSLPLGGEGMGLGVRLGLLFLSRCCVSYYYGVLFLYIIELYPEEIRSIGFGTVSACGALGGIVVQKVLSVGQEMGHDPLSYLFIFAVLCLLAAFHLPETHGQPLQVQIEELRTKKKGQKYEPSMEESFSDLDSACRETTKDNAEECQ